MSTIFSKIIKQEIPSYKIYEDAHTYAFLDIHPESRGHVLVIPKVEIDKIYDLPEDEYQALWAAVKKISLHMEAILGQRILIKVIGTDIPHAHVHLMPLDPAWQHGRTLKLSADELHSIAAQLAF